MRTIKLFSGIAWCAVALIMMSAAPAMAEEKPSAIAPAVASDGATVRVNYKLTVDGNEIDNSSGRGPLEFTLGGRQVIPGFEKAVSGMKVGDKKSVKIDPADGYGHIKPEAIRDVPKDQIPPEIKPEAGMMLYASGPGGQPIPVKIVEVKEDVLVMDFNHPLAGKTLNFDVELVEVKTE